MTSDIILTLYVILSTVTTLAYITLGIIGILSLAFSEII